jgi:putative ABC transport system permease protein
VPSAGRHTRLEKSRLWQKTGFSFQWNIRDVLRSRIRSTMAIVGVAGCSMLLVWAMGLNDSMNYVTQLYYRDINTYASKILFEETATKEDRAAVLADFDGQLIQESGIELSFDGIEKSGSLTVTDEGNELHFMDRTYDQIELPSNGMALSSKMADLLGAKVGDQIQWLIFGEKAWVTSEIVALFRTPMSQGLACVRPVYESLGRTMTPTAILTSSDAADARDMSGVKDIQSIQQQIDTFNSILNSMYMIIAILILAACLLGSVVLYNLGALSFSERTRELATLKVLGFSKKRINALLRAQNTWLTAIGICIGLPVGYGMLVLMMTTMAESSDFAAYIAPVSLVICVASTFLVSFLVNWILSTKVKTIDMVSSLKSVE